MEATSAGTEGSRRPEWKIETVRNGDLLISHSRSRISPPDYAGLARELASGPWDRPVPADVRWKSGRGEKVELARVTPPKLHWRLPPHNPQLAKGVYTFEREENVDVNVFCGILAIKPSLVSYRSLTDAKGRGQRQVRAAQVHMLRTPDNYYTYKASDDSLEPICFHYRFDRATGEFERLRDQSVSNRWLPRADSAVIREGGGWYFALTGSSGDMALELSLPFAGPSRIPATDFPEIVVANHAYRYNAEKRLYEYRDMDAERRAMLFDLVKSFVSNYAHGLGEESVRFVERRLTSPPRDETGRDIERQGDRP